MLLSALPEGPFAQLATLLGDAKPGLEPISLAVGDPQGRVPDFVQAALDKATASAGHYPAIAGTDDWRQAAADWLNSRFGLGAVPGKVSGGFPSGTATRQRGAVDPAHHVLPLNGTREGLFSVLFPLMPTAKGGGRPVVAMPNPFYQCYAAAALSAGAEPLYVPATEATGFLPDYAALPEAVLARIAAIYICAPSNPEGAVADAAYWRTLFALAEAYDFIVLADECYADIWYDAPPVTALPTRLAQAGDFSRLLSFHSLSKRSGLPGLRSGLVAGDAALIARFRAFRNVAGPQMPGPIQAASAAAWRDEAHVAAGRAAYREKMAAAQRILGNRVRRPGGGFFLWLDVGDGEAMALRLWREAGVRVLPGATMGRETLPGERRSNPGFAYIRLALVNDLSTITAALERVRDCLERA